MNGKIWDTLIKETKRRQIQVNVVVFFIMVLFDRKTVFKQRIVFFALEYRFIKFKMYL